MKITEKLKFENPTKRKLVALGIIATSPIWGPVWLAKEMLRGCANTVVKSVHPEFICDAKELDNYPSWLRMQYTGKDDFRAVPGVLGSIFLGLPIAVAPMVLMQGIVYPTMRWYKDFTK
ncbi:MAG: hypothetical protein FWF97_03790 [Alphaproteobacteria bacterium]|nr:hypothetical protein [Alphaproteobacteria bacterium]